MERLYSLVHRDDGAISTFTSREKAEQALRNVLADEPSWVDELRVESFEFLVDEPSEL